MSNPYSAIVNRQISYTKVQLGVLERQTEDDFARHAHEQAALMHFVYGLAAYAQELMFPARMISSLIINRKLFVQSAAVLVTELLAPVNHELQELASLEVKPDTWLYKLLFLHDQIVRVEQGSQNRDESASNLAAEDFIAKESDSDAHEYQLSGDFLSAALQSFEEIVDRHRHTRAEY